MSELERVIANLGYPVGMGMAPSPTDLARMKSVIIEECARVALRAQLSLANKSIEIWDREAVDRRNATIEECARVAETWRDGGPNVYDLAIAAAIRALKDRL